MSIAHSSPPRSWWARFWRAASALATALDSSEAEILEARLKQLDRRLATLEAEPADGPAAAEGKGR